MAIDYDPPREPSGAPPFDDATALIHDTSDPTKLARLDAGAIASGVTRVYALPNGDMTFVGLNLTQTLQNKELSSGTSFTVDPTIACKFIFTPSAADPRLNFGSIAGDPTNPANGDAWFNTSLGQYRGRIAGSTVSFATWLSRTGTVVHPSSATDDFAVGGNDSSAALFVDESAAKVYLNGSSPWLLMTGTLLSLMQLFVNSEEFSIGVQDGVPGTSVFATTALNISLGTGDNIDFTEDQILISSLVIQLQGQAVCGGPLKLKGYASGSEPSTPEEGWTIFDSTNKKIKFYNGTGWETVTSS